MNDRRAAGVFMDFHPLVSNPHLLTVFGNFWPRNYDFRGFSREERLIETEPGARVLVITERPLHPRGELVLVHGLEGGGDAGYVVSLAHRALRAGYVVHRFHMRTCGGTERHCSTLYHAGLSGDLRSFLAQHCGEGPVFLVGFSLGGNVVLKLAGELGAAGPETICGVATVSAAIDLALGARTIEEPRNRLYSARFVSRMKARLLRTGRYSAADLAGLHTIRAIDDCITAPSFGLGNAAHYYETQSAIRFVSRICVPALLIAAQDDPLIPFSSYERQEVTSNSWIRVLAPKHGGHLGFLAREGPRFWADERILEWTDSLVAAREKAARKKQCLLHCQPGVDC